MNISAIDALEAIVDGDTIVPGMNFVLPSGVGTTQLMYVYLCMVNVFCLLLVSVCIIYYLLHFILRHVFILRCQVKNQRLSV